MKGDYQRQRRERAAFMRRVLALVNKRNDQPMPRICWTITRQYLSRLSGPVRVLVAHFDTMAEAIELAEQCRRAWTCQVERWDKAGGEYKSRVVKRYPHKPAIETCAA